MPATACPRGSFSKMNALVGSGDNRGAYRASEAGVKIDLIVRGICCLRPGVKGLSKNITVRSIVDRYLEHSRIFYFENACQPEVFVGSADWMPRNFFRRIEVAFPIEDGNLRERIRGEILEVMLRDNSKARFLRPNGAYDAAKAAGGKAHRCQEELMELAQETPRAGQGAKTGAKSARMKLRPSPFESQN